MQSVITSLKNQLAELQKLHAAGSITEKQFKQDKAALERKWLDLLVAEPPAEAANASNRPSAKLLGILSVLVLLIACAGYWFIGMPQQQLQQEAQGEASDAAAHPITSDQMGAMTDKLAERLKNSPNDAEGWAMLARSYSVLGRNKEALEAYTHAANLLKDDPSLLADFADALATQNNNSLAGDPLELVQRALKLDPNNIKALALAGTEAFERKDYTAALKFWEKVQAVGPADHPLVRNLVAGIQEARSLAGLPALEALAPVAAAPKLKFSVTGVVSLSPDLLKTVTAQDTVFISVRVDGNSRMPLAAERIQVKDLPYSFTLDETKALSPDRVLSGLDPLLVSARVSKSGDAIPHPGDLIGQAGPMKQLVQDLKIEINQTVK